jgi:hypothetical protein
MKLAPKAFKKILIFTVISSVVHPDPAGSEIFCKFGSGSVVITGSDSGFEYGSKLSSDSN